MSRIVFKSYSGINVKYILLVAGVTELQDEEISSSEMEYFGFHRFDFTCDI